MEHACGTGGSTRVLEVAGRCLWKRIIAFDILHNLSNLPTEAGTEREQRASRE